MINFLDNKTVLFISPRFFSIEIEIIKSFKRNGASVYFYDEKPSNSLFYKMIFRLNILLVQNLFSLFYYLKIYSKIRNIDFDYFFLIKGEATPLWFIKLMKSKCNNLIYYTYDSVSNNPKSLKHFKLFNKAFTFDPLDSKKYKVNFRPLFCFSDFLKLNKNMLLNDIFIVATLHSDRAFILKEFIKFNKNKFSFFIFLFNKFGKLDFLRSLDFSSNSSNDLNYKFLKNNIYNKPMSLKKLLELYSNHICTFDIHSSNNQSGLTIRTFESLGSKTKLITTNKDIIKYPIYHPNNIFIIDRLKPNFDNFEKFLKLKFEPYNKKVKFSMSSDGWLHEIFIKNSSFWDFD